MKIQLMKEIASESGIEWNSKALEQKLCNPLVSEQDWTKCQKDQHNLHGKVEESPQKKILKLLSSITTTGKDMLEHISPYARKVVPDDEHSCLSRKSDDSPPVKYIEVIERQQNKPEIEIVPEEESDDKKSLQYKSILPPYLKSRASLTKNNSDTGSPTSSTGEENCKDDTAETAKDKPRSARTNRQTVFLLHPDKQYINSNVRTCARLLTFILIGTLILAP